MRPGTHPRWAVGVSRDRLTEALVVSAAVAFAFVFIWTGVNAPLTTERGSVFAAPVPPPPPATVVNPSSVPINHVVIIMQENHAYDDYYGTYCRALSSVCSYVGDGIPPGACLPINVSKPSDGCVKPFPFANATSENVDMKHNWETSHESYNNGSMNGFYQAEAVGNYPFGYYTGSILPAYWDMAEEYGLGDYFFSSALSYSLPNHWFLVAGNAPLQSEYTVLQTSNKVPLTKAQENYLNEANATPAIDDELVNSSVSWRYYDDPLLPTYQKAVDQHANGGAFAYWNPFAGKAQSYNATFSGHFVNRSLILQDAAQGRLPNVSFVIPSMPISEHPPEDVQNGENWTLSVVQAIEASPQWNHTAIFISWDEYGGFYDHVPPPQIDSFGLGFRVPLLVISPYTRQDYISDQLGSFDSLLHFLEWRFGLANFTARDGEANLPLSYFDFSATPRAPLTFANDTVIHYPMRMQGVGTPNAPGSFTGSAGPGEVVLAWKEPVGGAPVTYYRLHYGPKSNPTQYTIRIDGAATNITVANLHPGTAYTFTLRAAAAGNFSNAATLNTTAAGTFLVPSGTSGSSLLSSWLFGVPRSTISGSAADASRGRRFP